LGQSIPNSCSCTCRCRRDWSKEHRLRWSISNNPSSNALVKS
jgi:hypothetical protein